MNMRRVLVTTLATLLLLGPATAWAQPVPGPLADLQSQLSMMSLHAPGHVSMEIKDIATGYTSGVNMSASMPAASTIKIPVMVEVFRQLALGRFDFNTRVKLHRSDKDWGSGDLCDARVGGTYTVSRLLRAMITVSDNTATNMLIRLVGRQSINASMLSMGLEHTRLSNDIRSDGEGIRYALRSSASDMVSLLVKMANENLIDEWSSREMVSILSGQRHNNLIPQPLPGDVQIAHKTGTLHDTLNDVGIVYAQSEPYVIAVMTTNLPSLNAGRRFIRGVSRLAYDDLVRFGDWRESNGTGGVSDPAAGAAVTPQTPDATQNGGGDTPMWGANTATPAPASTPRPR